MDNFQKNAIKEQSVHLANIAEIERQCFYAAKNKRPYNHLMSQIYQTTDQPKIEGFIWSPYRDDQNESMAKIMSYEINYFQAALNDKDPLPDFIHAMNETIHFLEITKPQL